MGAEKTSKPIKRISFNLSTETNGYSSCSRTGLLVLATTPKHSSSEYEDENRNLKKTVTTINCKSKKLGENLKFISEGEIKQPELSIRQKSKISFSSLKKFFWDPVDFREEGVEKVKFGVRINITGSASPQRRKHLLLTETNFIGCIF